MTNNPVLKVIKDEVLNFVHDGFTIEILDDSCSFSEGPVWHPEGYYLFSDIPVNRIYKLKPGSSKEIYLENSGYGGRSDEYLSEQVGSNGLAFDSAGNLLVCQHGNGAVSKWDGNTLKQFISAYKGRRFNSPNDIVVGKDGSVFFSVPPYGLKDQQLRPGLAQEEAAYYCWNNGELQRFYNGYQYPNGLCLSADQAFLYTCSNKPFEARIKEFDTVTLQLTRVVCEENSDGIKCDRHNNFHLANKEGLLILNNEGKRMGLISLPTVPANLCWGGPAGNDLFVTAREHIFLLRNLQK